jgi:coproporphyrinogen III oxidase-like Fe-S oxidoreductase
MKNTKQKTIGDEIVEQIYMTGTTFTITMTEDCETQPTAILRDDICGDMTIIQSIANEIKVTHLDTNEIEAIKAILL